jgi:Flp pilus assembly protein TadG
MNKKPSLKGQTLVEFALLLPILLLLSVVVFDLGRAVYYYSAIHNAAREGARYGTTNPNDVFGMRNTTVNYAIGVGLNIANVTAGPGPNQIVGSFPNPTVRVSVNYSFSPATPLVANLLPGGQITLRSQATMRTEVLPSP